MTTNYDYDNLNRLTNLAQHKGAQTLESYAYDADGRRMSQTVGMQTTNYLWDTQSPYGDVIRETDENGATLASYVYGGAEMLSQNRNGLTSYYLPAPA